LRQSQTRALIADRLDEYGRYRPAAFGENFYALANEAVIHALVALVVLCSAPESGSLAQSESTRAAIAVFAGGCFWGVDAVFRHVTGVSKVVSGYAGGGADTANHETVSTAATGHAESVEVTYDPSQVSYEDLLKVFFLVAHDPTELNQQGPDSGTQYRSAIFYTNNQQRNMADAYIARSQKSVLRTDRNRSSSAQRFRPG
jgi:peptide-methionine (S)-S-oxide reductase